MECSRFLRACQILREGFLGGRDQYGRSSGDVVQKEGQEGEGGRPQPPPQQSALAAEKGRAGCPVRI